MNRAHIIDIDVRVSRKAVWGGGVERLTRLMAVLALTALSASCGDAVRQGTGSSYLIINSLLGASGAAPGSSFGGTLQSDVVTRGGWFSDPGQVTLELAMKNTLTAPTTANVITITRYRVRYTRADGRNTLGVDVPYGFDGAFTATVSGQTTVTFELVRHIAKQEAPLRALAFNFAPIIYTITEVTFYGHDQTGHEVSVSGQLLVAFSDFADPG